MLATALTLEFGADNTWSILRRSIQRSRLAGGLCVGPNGGSIAGSQVSEQRATATPAVCTHAHLHPRGPLLFPRSDRQTRSRKSKAPLFSSQSAACNHAFPSTLSSFTIKPCVDAACRWQRGGDVDFVRCHASGADRCACMHASRRSCRNRGREAARVQAFGCIWRF